MRVDDPGFDDLIYSDLADQYPELPEGAMTVKIPIVAMAGEIRISDQLLSGRFTAPKPPSRRLRVRSWLRNRAIQPRDRVAVWIAPWLDDRDDW